MPCYRPVEGYRSTNGALTFKRGPLSTGQLMKTSCGQCIGCRIRRSKEWAVRCVHESRMTTDNMFLTLTYDDEHMPVGRSVSRTVHQKFMKDLRRFARRKLNVRENIRFYMCGEYGADEYMQVPEAQKRLRLGPGRPHYHYLIFGLRFPDLEYWTTHRGHHYYCSAMLEDIWQNGFSTIGNVTPETAAYTARYVLKKILGDEEQEDNHYRRLIPETGESWAVEPEFCLMSLKPGIGAEWFSKYGQTDIYDSGDYVTINGKRYQTPRYYDKLLQDLDERELMRVKSARRKKAGEKIEDQHW